MGVHAALVSVQLAFAGHAVASKLVLEDLAPGALAFLRALTGGLLLLAVHLITRGLPRVPLADLAKLAGCALLGIAGNQVLFFEGLARTTAINASVLVTTIPVFTLIVAIALRREPARGLAILGVALAFCGVLYLLGFEALSMGGDTVLGDALVLINAAAYGTYLVLVVPLVKRHGTMTVVVWLFAFGALWTAPYGAPDLITQAPALGLEAWLLIAFIVLFATVLTYLANAWALRRAPPSLVAIYIYLQPIGAALLAMLVLGETLTPRVVASAVLVFAGIALVTRRPKAAPERRS